MSKTTVNMKSPVVESVDVYHFSTRSEDGRNVFRITHRINANGAMLESEMSLTREQAEWVRDQLNVVLMETDPAYKAWSESKDKSYGVGPLDTEDPASRFAHEEPLPATDDEWKDRLVEGGA